MRVLRGVVYILKRRGPRTDPCGTPHVSGIDVELELFVKTEKEREDRYDVNQFKAVSVIPNQEERR